MSALQKRVSKLEGPIEAGEQIDFIIQLIEPGTMQVTSRLRLIPGGGAVKVDDEIVRAVPQRADKATDIS